MERRPSSGTAKRKLICGDGHHAPTNSEIVERDGELRPIKEIELLDSMNSECESCRMPRSVDTERDRLWAVNGRKVERGETARTRQTQVCPVEASIEQIEREGWIDGLKSWRIGGTNWQRRRASRISAEVRPL